MVDKTGRLLRKMKQKAPRFEPKTPVGGDFFLPNHSGRIDPRGSYFPSPFKVPDTWDWVAPTNSARITFDHEDGDALSIYGSISPASLGKLQLFAEVGELRPSILLRKNNTMQFDVNNAYSYIFKENNNTYLTLNRSGSTYTPDNTAGESFIINAATVLNGAVMQLNAVNLTSGEVIEIVTDSDELNGGKLIACRGGSGRSQDWFSVIKNTSDTEGCQVIVDGDNVAGAAAKPSLRIGTGEDGFYKEVGTGYIDVALGGAHKWRFNAGYFNSSLTNGPNLRNETATATNPVYVIDGDLDTGIGWAGADQLSLIAGGVEGIRITEDTSITVTVNGTLAHTSDDVGFYGVTPTSQAAKINDPAGGGTIDAEARTAIAAIIDALEAIGITST